MGTRAQRPDVFVVTGERCKCISAGEHTETKSLGNTGAVRPDAVYAPQHPEHHRLIHLVV